MVNKNKTISQHMSDIAKQRKNPYLGFKDPKKASEAGKRSAELRAKAKKTTTSKNQPKV